MFGRILEALLWVYFPPPFFFSFSFCLFFVFGNLVKENESCCQQTLLPQNVHVNMYLFCFTSIQSFVLLFAGINIDHFFFLFVCVCTCMCINNNRDGNVQEPQE